MLPDFSGNDDLIPGHRRQSSDDSLIPMINVVFLLLIFFMVAGQIKASANPDLVLPFADTGTSAEEQAHRLEITASGALTLDGAAIDLAALGTALAGWDAASAELAVLADKRLTARQLDEVLTPIRQRGIATVKLYSDSQEAQP